MNAKKKNKKANKPPNPNPPQKVEHVPVKEKKVKESTPKCENVKEEILLSEGCCEVVEIPVSEVKEIKSDTPKTPKRNKGKNKKQGKDEPIEVQEQPQPVLSECNVKAEETLQEIAISIEEKKSEEIADPLEETNMVPSARKKKNKKKVQEKQIQETKTPVDNSNTTVSKVQATEQIEKGVIEMPELLSSTPGTPEPERKKKNKNKKRTDSERSDKSDNVLSYTSAFQNILTENTSTPENFDNTARSNTDLKLDSENVITEGAVEPKVAEEIQELKIDIDNKKEILKSDNKGKKKNKKDKKQQPEKTIDASKYEIFEEIPEASDDALTQTTFIVENKQEVKESEQTLFDTHKEEETSPKSKAKIAKPVEKKRKGILEIGSSENIPENIEIPDILKDDKIIDEPSKEHESKSEASASSVEPDINIIESQIEDQIKQEILGVTSSIEINNSSDHAMGKKRKKSPKPQKNKGSSVKSNEELESEKSNSECISATKDTSKILDLQVESHIAISDATEIPETVPEETLKPLNEPIIDITQMQLVETPEIKQDDEGFEIKTSKKKKKTPKIPQAEASLKDEDKELIAEITKTEEQKQISEEFKQTSVDPKQVSEEQVAVSSDSYHSGEIEVQNIFGPETSSCDLIPEVHFMRSSSQHLDNNNNTVIQEIIDVEEIKLNHPQFIPLIEGSGATPARSPEPVASGIRMTEIETIASTEEKTDIKSKIMEVNQDMEELRLSIERSLAEFTALEKSEEEIENKTEKSMEKEKSPVFKGKTKEAKHTEREMPEVKENIAAMPEVKQNISRVEKIKEPEIIIPTLTEAVLKPIEAPPVCPARKDNKGKGKSKKKGQQESATATPITTANDSSTSQAKDNTKEESKEKSEEKPEQKTESTQEKSKQQSTDAHDNDNACTSNHADNGRHPLNSELIPDTKDNTDFEPIDNFEDALTSSIDDLNKTFEMIAKDADDDNTEFQKKLAANKPEISITAAEDTDTNRNAKVNPVSQPKNLLGHTDIPVQSNKPDYKKEKNKTPNARQAKVKIKDSSDIESNKQSKESQTDSKRSRKISDKSVIESFSRVKNDNEEYVYKYSFRKVFLQSACHVCNKKFNQVRVPCGYCNLVFYCDVKHKDEDWPLHQALCFAVSTLAHMKDQKHIYADAANSTGQDYRLLRMQTIVSCERILKRRLVPWEQELMLYPRMCADVACREWCQGKLKDCDGCGQLSFCTAHSDHLPKVHSRWCKSYSLYQKLVTYQQTKGRLEPRLPTKVLSEGVMPGKMNDVLAALYEEKIDMNDIQYASLTQLATAPLTTAYCLQLCTTATGITNGVHKKHPLTIHVVGAELQFEADALNKWETFFLHLRPDVDELRIVLVSPQLNPGNLPLDLLGRIKLCDNCQQNKRRVIFKFEDNKNYFEYRSSEDFINPDIICAFNPSIQRSSIYSGKDLWPATINSILKLKIPFIVTSYTLNELRKDIARIKQVSELDFKLISEPSFNSFASVRPDRNFISDDEMPLLFKNYCFSVLLGC